MHKISSPFIVLFCSIFLLLFIPGTKCRKSRTHISDHRNNNEDTHATYKPENDVFPGYPMEFSRVFADASDVFRNVLGKMLSKKKILGINNSEWYW